jgi:DNA-binding transcriptional ArsR family regulator
VAAYVHPLDALGEPTRRQIFELLRDGPLPVGVVAEQLPVSRPAVSQHLRVLEGAGLVAYRKVGTRRLYEVDPGGVAELRAWIDDFWNEALARYTDAAEEAAARVADREE